MYAMRKIVRFPDSKKTHIAIVETYFEDGKKISDLKTLCGSSKSNFHPRLICPDKTMIDCKICLKFHHEGE